VIGERGRMEVQAMERIGGSRSTRASAGFTLVELLVVMSIIGVLIGLLYPGINAAVRAARVARTQAIIQSLTVGLEAFKGDWGVYPPSNNSGDDKLEGGPTGQGVGYRLMAVALMGLDGKGWGVRAVDQTGATDWVLPFGGQARNAYGPYFQQESGATGYVRDGFPTYGSGGFILYYRFDPADSPVSGLFGKYDGNDNPLGNDKFQDGAGFNDDQGHFRLSAMYTAADGVSRWQRPDYLLISPGPDRLYGHVYFDPTSPDVLRAATSAEVGQGKAVYDDVTNFQ